MPSVPLTPGTRVGRYEIVAHLATGGMGEVYRARDIELERDVALKLLPESQTDNSAALERFRREARAAARLSHKNIVTLYDWGQDGGTWYLALEFIDGVDLHSRIVHKGRLRVDEALVITLQAARALDHASRHGVIHRDIKPSNFLLVRDGQKMRVKLTDFGLARTNQEGQYRITRDGSTVGTIDYMAPEQARDSTQSDVRSDIYSLGCTLYHMLSGQPPFPDGGLGERLYKHMQLEPTDVRELNPEVPEALWLVLQRMLAKKPEDRYQTAADLIDAVRQLRVDDPKLALSQPPPTETLPIPHHPPPPTGTAELTSPDVLNISAEQRQAAATQFERAREILASGAAEKRYAYELLLSCCNLDPTNLEFRRRLRKEIRQRQGTMPATTRDARPRLDAARQASDHRKVLECGEEVLMRFPDDLATHFDMAEAASALGLGRLEIWLLRQACKVDEKNVEPLRRLARAYERQKNLGRAIAAWHALRKVLPEDADAPRMIVVLLRRLARAYERKQDLRSSIEVWQALCKVKPGDGEATRRIEELSSQNELRRDKASSSETPH
jgi:serine/threonine protein kinase